MDLAARLCMDLMRADREDEVVDLLTAAGYWDMGECWRPIGDIENNFGPIGNQQSEAIAALIEKIVNSVDARLTNACLLVGIDPTEAKAPQSIRAAVARFFEGKAAPNDTDGYIAEWTNSRATDEGRLLTVAATGLMPNHGSPSISIADQGEGQTPDTFPETFMSLSLSNKLRIPFVQGKFNMGGTGALQFCGSEHRMQLVVSRRNPTLVASGASRRDYEWGFTIVRREPPAAGSRNSVFTYLAPVNAMAVSWGDVLSFPAESWPIFPEADDKVRDAYSRESEYGSLIKLYEYGWQGTTSNIVSSGDGLLRRIDVGLPDLALPVRLFECRPGYKGHRGSFATNALGLVARLERDRGENLELDAPAGGVITLGGRQIRLRAFVFAPDKAKQYRNPRHGVVFAVNGQMHGAFPIDFFRRKAVGMSYLADSLLMVVDCTSIDGQTREDLFMNSRDRLRDNPLGRRLEQALEAFLRNNSTLRGAQNRRRQATIKQQLKDDKPLADVLQNLLRSNPTLSKLLLRGLNIPSPFPPNGGIGKGNAAGFKGRRFPTFFRFKEKREGEDLVREAHLRSRTWVALETDAEDDYFVREIEPGAWNVRTRRGGELRDTAEWITTGPRSGVARLLIDALPDGVAVGDEVEYEIEVTDPSRVDAFTNRLKLKVRGPHKSSGGGNGRSKIRGPSMLELPEITPVRRDEWGTHEFNEDSALRVVHSTSDGKQVRTGRADVYDFFINVDNKHLLLAQKERPDDTELLEKQFTYGLVIVGLALLQDDQRLEAPKGSRRTLEESDTLADVEDVERVIGATTRAIAPVFLPLLETIGDLSADDL